MIMNIMIKLLRIDILIFYYSIKNTAWAQFITINVQSDMRNFLTYIRSSKLLLKRLGNGVNYSKSTRSVRIKIYDKKYFV